ncbi:MAG TPA: ARMT1-like domain-containing protein [Bacteroidales bacterium]|nr:ARMT1-like domain-containing protein [Bacteroidales bacterium]HNS45602.1 ARMT1-like domain-containing protein [Bacteroidales bacterium]
MHADCLKCFLSQAGKLLHEYDVPDTIAGNIRNRFMLFIDNHQDISAPEAACLMHRLIKKATCTEDPYQKAKSDYNELLLQLEDEIRSIIRASDDPFQMALRYALAGNIIDFGPQKPFDVLKALSEAAFKEPYIDHSLELKRELKNASMVLYLGDNAGEIVLDKLFIETINHPNLYFAVRGSNILNDVTMEDADRVGLKKIASVISNGYDAPSTLVNKCSLEFRKIYEGADIIISKGQGNLEGLIDTCDKKIFFLLMVKCNVIAERVEVKEKNVVVLYNQILLYPSGPVH